MVKVTYSLDDATVRRIRRTAERLGKPQSHVVREAVAEYDARTDRLSEAERLRMLAVLDRWRREPVTRSREHVEAELREIRESRRLSGLHRQDVLDRLHEAPSTRSRESVETELREIRASRREGWERRSDA